jgi:hypothetical protein
MIDIRPLRGREAISFIDPGFTRGYWYLTPPGSALFLSKVNPRVSPAVLVFDPLAPTLTTVGQSLWRRTKL